MSSMPSRLNLRVYSRPFGTCLLNPNRCFADEVIAATHYVGSWHYSDTNQRPLCLKDSATLCVLASARAARVRQRAERPQSFSASVGAARVFQVLFQPHANMSPRINREVLGRQTLLAPSRPFAIVRIDGHPLLTPPLRL